MRKTFKVVLACNVLRYQFSVAAALHLPVWFCCISEKASQWECGHFGKLHMFILQLCHKSDALLFGILFELLVCIKTFSINSVCLVECLAWVIADIITVSLKTFINCTVSPKLFCWWWGIVTLYIGVICPLCLRCLRYRWYDVIGSYNKPYSSRCTIVLPWGG